MAHQLEITMPYFDVTIRVRVEANNSNEAEDDVMAQAQLLNADGVYLEDSEEVENEE